MYRGNHRTVKEAGIFILLSHPLSSTAPHTFIAEFQPSPQVSRIINNLPFAFGGIWIAFE